MSDRAARKERRRPAAGRDPSENVGENPIVGSLQEAPHPADASLSDILATADALWADFRFGHALGAFQNAAARAPANPAPLLLAAKRLFSVGRFAESGEHLRAALAREPQNISLRRMLAEVLERAGEPTEAESLAREALRQSPADARTARALAHIVRRCGRLEEAVEILRSHLHRYPEGERWRLNQEMAICLDIQGEYEEAMKALLRAKAELRPVAEPLLAQWRQRATRREEFAKLLDESTLQRWRKAGEALQTSHRIAILAGHPRSGTTLLEQMLARHSSLVTTDETGILRRQFVEPIVMEAQSSEAALAEVDGFDLDQLEIGRAFYFRATEEHVGESLGERIVIEKDPLATCDLGLILRLLPECRIIFPLRDPRDVCVSFFFTLLPLNADSAPALDLGSTCAAAEFTLRLWKHWRSILPQRWEEVRYESLVVDPRGELTRLMQSLSLPFEERMLLHAKPPGARGVSTPTYADVSQPIYTRSVGRWRNYARWLDPHLESLTPLLQEFGYQ